MLMNQSIKTDLYNAVSLIKIGGDSTRQDNKTSVYFNVAAKKLD